MNKLIKVFFLTVILFAVNGFVSAQAPKIAHVNTAEIMNVMPERPQAEQALETFYNGLQEQLRTMYAEYQTKLQDYQANAETMSNLVKQSKERELVDLESRITAFQSSAEEEFEAKRAELLRPLLERIQNAIDAVGAEKHCTYVFDLSTGAAVYVGTDAIDITPDVKSRLGIRN